MAIARDEIAIIREYRTRLIADVVTGKLDVREAATHLPDDLEDPQLLDGVVDQADADAPGDIAGPEATAAEVEM